MDEIAVLDMIAKGESSTVEFKRELDLSTAKQKAEFVKDIIALANSTTETAHLIIGVDDSQILRGIEKLDDEVIQQVAQTYITAPVSLRCQVIPLTSPSMRLGLIEVSPRFKPHKVARSIERLPQHRVFVRHGTIVTEATPEEINAMYGEELDSPKSRRYIKAAQAHAEVGNLESAANAYSAAIEISPSAQLFLARAKVYEELRDLTPYGRERDNWSTLSFDDYTRAMKLTPSREQHKEIRRSRFRVIWGVKLVPTSLVHPYAEELEWMKANLTGRELGEAIYIHVKNCADDHLLRDETDALSDLNQVIELGYREADVYALRAQAHFFASNYGMALDDINVAIKLWKGEVEPVHDYFTLKANILAFMGPGVGNDRAKHFREALAALDEAHERGGHDYMGYVGSNLELDLMYTLAFRHYSKSDEQVPPLHSILMQRVCLSMRGYGPLSKRFPEIAHLVRRIVGDAFWQDHKELFG